MSAGRNGLDVLLRDHEIGGEQLHFNIWALCKDIAVFSLAYQYQEADWKSCGRVVKLFLKHATSYFISKQNSCQE